MLPRFAVDGDISAAVTSAGSKLSGKLYPSRAGRSSSLASRPAAPTRRMLDGSMAFEAPSVAPLGGRGSVSGDGAHVVHSKGVR